MASLSRGAASDRWGRPLTQFFAVMVLGLLVVGGGAFWASQRAGHSEALNEARSLTEQSARSIIGPNLTQELLSGDAGARRKLDDDIRDHLLSDKVVRVKLWAADGSVVYSDVGDLIGETYELDPLRLEAVEHAVAVADVSHHHGAENRFEADLGELLEVYLPIDGPDGETLLFETYFDAESVALSSERIRTSVVPIVLVSLAAMGVLTMTMARRMTHRMDSARIEREQLLARAVDASTHERRRIAADLHDGVIQDLAGTSLLLNSAITNANADNALALKLETTSEALRHSLTSLRSLAIEIHPPNIASANLQLTLEDQLVQAEARHGLHTTFEFADSAATLDEDHKRLIYRFVLEGLRNVAKHAKAEEVALSVVTTPTNDLRVTLSDDGEGFDEQAPMTGMGIALLGELAADVGAEVTITGRNGLGGTTLALEISS